ncbi:sulfatase-like hydrolase/transferase [Kineococcus sp. LSe6-4]|uniref:Sulfatase-like hydrolase/transferase n=1 Tax=Kineococcus halophytocola TaxID=3234027 RepID=A0ABV4H5V4_9ACTN
MRHRLWRQDLVNRTYLTDPRDHPQNRTVDAGLEFLRTNRDEDGWMLQIECFDPHEPFFSHAEHRRHYPDLPERSEPGHDWPDYAKNTEDAGTTARIRDEYSALLTMCDASLGRVLDHFDTHDLWSDTLLLVGTDHGFLLGEHGWWGKNVQSWYDENIHTPLFVWDPRSARAGERRGQLVQTVDFGPTLLDHFGIEPTPTVLGRSLLPVLRENADIRSSALFGVFGGHVNVTDGRYVYMRSCTTPENAPLFEHTLMPTHMNARFDVAELRGAELVGPLPFTRDVPVLRVPGRPFGNPHAFGTLLFDLAEDPEQQHPLLDDDLELRMLGLLLEAMRAADAPASQYERLGLPAEGPAGTEHLLARAQRDLYEDARAPVPAATEFGGTGVTRPLTELLDRESTREVLTTHLGPAVQAMAGALPGCTVLDLAAFNPALTTTVLHTLDDALTSAATAAP